MSGNRKRLYYRLTPVFEPEPGAAPQIVNAAAVTCMFSGRLLAGGGGGAEALAPDIVDLLRGGEGAGVLLMPEPMIGRVRAALINTFRFMELTGAGAQAGPLFAELADLIHEMG